MIAAAALAALLLAVLFGRWWVRRRLPPLSKVRRGMTGSMRRTCRITRDETVHVSTASQPAVLLLCRAQWPSSTPLPMAAAAASACCGARLGLDSACSGMAGLGSRPPDVPSSDSVL